MRVYVSTAERESRSILLAVITLLLLFQLGIILFTTPAGQFSFMVFGANISIGRNVYKTFPLFLITSYAYFRLTRRKIQWVGSSGPLAAVATAVLLTSASSMAPYDSLKEGIRILLCAGFYVALINLPWEDVRFRRILVCFPLGIFVLTVKAVYNVVSGAEMRAGDFVGHPNVLGAFCVITIPFLLFLATSLPQWRWKVLLQVSTCLLSLALVLTFSRGAYLAAGASLLFLAVMGGWRARAALIPMVIILSTLLGIAWPAVSSRFKETESEFQAQGPRSRLYIWDATFSDAFPDMPLWGWGAENGFTVRVESREIFRTDRPPAPRLAHPHNQFLDILVAGGMPALIAWVWLTVATIGRAYEHARCYRVYLLPYLFSVIIALVVMGVFESILTSRNILPTIVLVLAMLETLPQFQLFTGTPTVRCKM